MQGFEYAMLGGSLLLSLVLFMMCLLLFSLRKSWSVSLGRSVGEVETKNLGWLDLAGVGLIFVIYLGNWIDLGRVYLTESANTRVIVMQLVLQVGFCGLVLGVLYRRVNFREFWGLRPVRYWWVIGVTFVGIGSYFVVLEVLWAMGFEDWMAKVFPRVFEGVPGDFPEITFSYQLVLGVVLVISAPLMEEMVFRGYLYPVLKRMGGLWLAAVTVSLFFAAAHLEGSYLLGRFVLSLILIAAYELTGSLWAPVGIHFLNNLYVFVGSLGE